MIQCTLNVLQYQAGAVASPCVVVFLSTNQQQLYYESPFSSHLTHPHFGEGIDYKHDELIYYLLPDPLRAEDIEAALRRIAKEGVTGKNGISRRSWPRELR